jgi:hypothetical protein
MEGKLTLQLSRLPELGGFKVRGDSMSVNITRIS